MIILNLTDREAAILYLKFDLLIHKDETDEDLDTVFKKLEQSLLIRKKK